MMNEPIISPWIFYVADVVGSINLVINVLMWILCIATAIAFCDYMSNRSPYKEAETIQNQKTFHSLLKVLKYYDPGTRHFLQNDCYKLYNTCEYR